MRFRTVMISMGLMIFAHTHLLWAQEPDLNKLPNADQKIKAWIAYCESLRLNPSGAADNFVVLEKAGQKGLLMLSPDDFTNRAKCFFYIAIGNYYQVKFDSAQFYFYKSLASAEQGHNAVQITKACVALIPVNFQLQQPDKVEACKNILQSIADTTRSEALEQDLYYALGSYYQQKSYYSTAQDYFIKSIQLREKEVDTTTNAKKKFDFAIQCDMLSKLYLNTEMVDKSLDALRKGERFASVSPNVENRLLSSFIEAYTSSGNIDSALYYNTRLETQTQKNPNFPSEVVSADLNIALYYINRKQYPKALPFIEKADDVVTEVKSPLLTFQAQMVRGRYLEETGKYDQSIAILMPAMPVARQLSKELYSNILKFIALDEKGKGNAVLEAQYYQEYVQASDSLTKEKLSRTFADFETLYQTNEKEQKIQSLDKENRLRTLELQNASHQRQLLVLGLVALGIISLLLFFNYRGKEKLNFALNEQNERLDQVNQHLAEANDTKARLFGIIGHDLRSPVSKIVQLLQLQKEGSEKLSEAARKGHEEHIKKASENVLETMEDLLIWSKSQMESFSPIFLPVHIRDLVLNEIHLLKDQYENEDLVLDCRVPESFVESSDENFLIVIFRNLLQNAIRYGGKFQPIVVESISHSIVITNYSEREVAVQLNQRLADSRIDSKKTGLGLQIASDLAKRIGTSLYFQQKDPKQLQVILSWESA
jgi:signal transduction histidine kinase